MLLSSVGASPLVQASLPAANTAKEKVRSKEAAPGFLLQDFKGSGPALVSGFHWRKTTLHLLFETRFINLN